MAPRNRKADIVAKRVHDLIRKRALQAISGHDEALSKEYERIAEGIRRDLRASGFTIREVREILEKHISGSSAQRTAIVETAIRDAARTARGLDEQTFEALFGKADDAVPLDRPSARTPRRSVRLVRASEDEPPSTD